MIIDVISNAALYNNVNPRFAKAFQYLKSIDLATIAEGKYEIEGSDIFMTIVDNKELKTKQNAALEVHDKYIDIQILIKGKEGFGWADRALCKAPREAMDKQKDIQFFDDKPSTYFTIDPMQFAIFFPDDAHAPLVGEGIVKKCIIKVLAA